MQSAKANANPQRDEYRSYLLRLSRQQPDGWSATLISVTNPRDLFHFTDLDALFIFLIQQLSESPDLPPEQGTARGSNAP